MSGLNGHDPPAPAYAERALAEECALVERAPNGTSNAVLNKSAGNIGTMVGAGWLDRSTAEAALEEAASKRCDDEREARRTIKSGLYWGERHPRAPVSSFAPRAGRQRTSKASRASAIFEAAHLISDTIAERYLASRNIVPPLTCSLRFAPATRMTDGNEYPAMIAAVTVPTTGKLIAIQRTALASDGNGKAVIETPKASLGSTAGGAVVLGNLDSASVVLEGEGVETVLSACQATELPGIATLSASTLGKPPLPVGAAVIMLGDRGSETATEAGAQRRHDEGRHVRIAYPPLGGGKDFNDLLRSSGDEAVRTAIETAMDFVPSAPSKSYSSRCLAMIEPQPIDWLWPDRMARGKINLLAGHPGRGKSTLTLHMAALVSTGGTWPDGASCPHGNVVFITCEDDAADTLVPRLEAAGADRSRCHLLDTVNDANGNSRPFNLKSDVAALDELANDIGGILLLVIDPISAYLDGIDSHSVADVRGALLPLQHLADRLGAAILLVSHFNKGTPDGSAMSRVAGSGAFVAVCRSAWAIDRVPDHPGGKRRILAPMKNNVGDDRTGFAFELEQCDLGSGISGSRVRFLHGTVDISADELVRAQAQSTMRSSALSEASAFLAKLLEAGPLPQREIETAGEEAGHKERTLHRAKKSLGIKSRRRSDGWYWELPKRAGEEPDPSGGQDCQDGQDHQEFIDARVGCLDEQVANSGSTVGQGCQAVPTKNPGNLGHLGNLEGFALPSDAT